MYGLYTMATPIPCRSPWVKSRCTTVVAKEAASKAAVMKMTPTVHIGFLEVGHRCSTATAIGDRKYAVPYLSFNTFLLQTSCGLTNVVVPTAAMDFWPLKVGCWK